MVGDRAAVLAGVAAGEAGVLEPGGLLADALDQAHREPAAVPHVQQLVLHRRGAGVEDEDTGGGGHCWDAFSLGDWAGVLGLDRRDGDGVDDVLDEGAPGQVVDRLAQTLQDRADGDGAGRALHGLAGVVAGVEVGEDQHAGLPRDLGVGQLGGGDGRLHGRVVLDRTLDLQVRPARAGPARWPSRTLSTSAPRPGRTRGVRQHRDPRLHAELRRRTGRLDGDVRELLGVRVRVDRAVAVDQHLVGQAHEEHRRHDRGVRPGLDDLEGGAGWVAAVECTEPDTMPSARPSLDHQGCRSSSRPRRRRRASSTVTPLVGAQGRVLRRRSRAARRWPGRSAGCRRGRCPGRRPSCGSGRPGRAGSSRTRPGAAAPRRRAAPAPRCPPAARPAACRSGPAPAACARTSSG